MMELMPWKENTCYKPVTHWLLYSKRGAYVARVDLYPWNNGRYTWRVQLWSMTRNDPVGLADTLEEAQREAERVLLEPVEKPLQIGQLSLF